MALLLALQECRHRIRAAAHMQPEQDVVVAVEDRKGFGWGHLWSSFFVKQAKYGNLRFANRCRGVHLLRVLRQFVLSLRRLQLLRIPALIAIRRAL